MFELNTDRLLLKSIHSQDAKEIERIIFEDPEVVKDQSRMAEDIANSMNMRELPR